MKFEFKKSLGQNFIKDNDIIEKIISNADIDAETLVIEIGPGSGILTKEILKRAKFAILYEIDTRLERILNQELKEFNNYKIIFNDFLKADIINDIKQYEYKKIYIIANLPYYITTPIIKKIIEDKIIAEKIIIMIQKEVANRLVAKPNTTEYGSITVFLNYYYDIKKLFDVSKKHFVPRPKVDSSVIEMKRKKNFQSVKNMELFNNLIRDSFKFKRKTLKNNLYSYNLTKIEKILKKYDLNLSSRAENISLEVFIDICNNLDN